MSTEGMRKKRHHQQRVLDRYKVRKGCAQCGYKENPLALEFDHVKPIEGQRVRVGRLLGGSWERVKKELALCQVLCGNCHNIKTRSAQRALRSQQ